ncbi:MAG: histidine ammonia-lyase [Planctomycetota bacterium]|nr:histidine ammonia-lyase [Planctomycetota bacterium]
MNGPKPSTLFLDAGPLDVVGLEQVARQMRRVALAPAARDRLARSRSALEAAMNQGAAIYGVNTGFGSLSRVRIPDNELSDVQHNLLRSHAAGIGPPLPTDVVRGMMLLLAASLARGHSGVRPEVAEAVVALLNAQVTPLVPETGSVGASGDLAPLAHAALLLIGEGYATIGADPTPVPGPQALQRAGLKPIALAAKEGLALINGTHLMAAHAALLLADFDRLFDAALCAVAMSIDACRATDAFLDDRVYHIRRHPGAARAASRIRSMLEGSQVLTSHIENDPRVQDPYSLRCAAYVMGSALDAADFVRRAAERELGAVTDNPLVFPDEPAPGERSELIVSAGNFHGMPIALPLDVLAIALAHLAGISERRTFLMLAAAEPEARLRPHLSPRPGLHSGLMIVQYTAAACCNELVQLAAPASPINLPTCAGMEDYNSFGPRSAAKARRALDLCTSVIAIELLCAAQGLELHRPLRSGRGVERTFEKLRSVVPPLTADRPPAPDIAAITALIRAGALGD